MIRRLHRATAATLATSLAAVAFAASPAAATADGCALAGRTTKPNTWAQQLLAPDRAWPFSRGAGQRIALLDSGVDAQQPMLRGHVVPGFNALAGHGTADADCDGTGTQVAGVIVAHQAGTDGLAGVAPDATIVPVQVTGQPGSNDNGVVPPAVLSRAIDWAVQRQVDVIDISVTIVTDDPRVQASVAAAVVAGITVVAAAGDHGAPDDGNPTPYPAAYPGVIGVSAVDVTGARWANAGHGGFVDLVAPGAGVVTTQRGRGWVTLTGSTAVATGYVSGVAALVRARWPHLTPGQVSARLLGTAAPSADGPDGQQGSGLVNPYAAVTDDLVAAKPAAVPVFRPVTPNPDELRAQAARDRSKRLAITLTVAGLGVLVIVMLAAVGLPRARRRGWRPTHAAPLPERIEPDEPAAPSLLFEEPAPR